MKIKELRCWLFGRHAMVPEPPGERCRRCGWYLHIGDFHRGPLIPWKPVDKP